KRQFFFAFYFRRSVSVLERRKYTQSPVPLNILCDESAFTSIDYTVLFIANGRGFPGRHAMRDGR
ncbi:MAG TPA: hypothetical protein VHL14_06640, partial [Steroidobacteraceae bacterium]|nr:hypothetical protein [Steroidobacteraceae bacterium]